MKDGNQAVKALAAWCRGVSPPRCSLLLLSGLHITELIHILRCYSWAGWTRKKNLRTVQCIHWHHQRVKHQPPQGKCHIRWISDSLGRRTIIGSRIYFSLNQEQRQAVNAFRHFLPGNGLDFNITFKQAWVNIWRLYEGETSCWVISRRIVVAPYHANAHDSEQSDS